MRQTHLEHQFVKQFPERLQPGVLYISMEYATATHCCYCGCGEEVITPFTPRDWKMTFDGETVSLSPSIGNWNFACRSHYFIKRGQVIEAATWTDKQIKANRHKDKAVKASYYGKSEQDAIAQPPSEPEHSVKPRGRESSLIKLGCGTARTVWRKILGKTKS